VLPRVVMGQLDCRAAGAGYPLDMALNSVDDQYDCWKEMFLNELNLDYQEGEKNAKKPEDNLKNIHSVSIYMYTNNNSDVYRNFNNAYSLHFLLTDATKILKKTQNKCYLTYRGTPVEFDNDVLNKEIRLGSFTSSSLNRKVAQHFGTRSCFEIETCEGADVIKYSKYPEQKEVLIPPYETFKVSAVKKRADQKDPWCDIVYILKKTGGKSYLNCRVDKSSMCRFPSSGSGLGPGGLFPPLILRAGADGE
uniref:NAD(P)(+)--arginine ADP-ribosyltransferase n=1 Tax=Sinocyclocheilus rhinocerous TaxID=307959 RepID=A0A673NKX5_9TELE